MSNQDQSENTFVSMSEEELMALAHEASPEAIAKIEAYLEQESDEEKRAIAEMALEECEFFHYQPTNEQEDRDFLLCALIDRKRNNLEAAGRVISRMSEKLRIFEIEKKVHKSILADQPDKVEAWQDYGPDEAGVPDSEGLAVLKSQLEYDEAWVTAATGMIVSEKYQGGIPERHLSHFSFEFDPIDDDVDEKWHNGCGDKDCLYCGPSETLPF